MEVPSSIQQLHPAYRGFGQQQQQQQQQHSDNSLPSYTHALNDLEHIRAPAPKPRTLEGAMQSKPPHRSRPIPDLSTVLPFLLYCIIAAVLFGCTLSTPAVETQCHETEEFPSSFGSQGYFRYRCALKNFILLVATTMTLQHLAGTVLRSFVKRVTTGGNSGSVRMFWFSVLPAFSVALAVGVFVGMGRGLGCWDARCVEKIKTPYGFRYGSPTNSTDGI